MLGEITTGAGNDIERATEMARTMVCEWGMSDAWARSPSARRKSRSSSAARSRSARTTARTRRSGSTRRSSASSPRTTSARWRSSRSTRSALQKLADALLAREVLDGDQVKRIVAGLPIDDRRRRRSAGAAARRERRPHAQGIAPRRSCPTCTIRCRSHSEVRVASAKCAVSRRSAPASRFPARTALALALRVALAHFLLRTCIRAAPPLLDSAAGRRAARPGRAHARHGRAQRHARFLRRRRTVRRSRRAPSTRRCAMEDAGADIIDIGGESTRPGADGGGCRRTSAAASSRSSSGWRGRMTHPDVDRHLQGGGGRARPSIAAPLIVNDVSALRYDPGLAHVVARARRGGGADAQPRPLARHVPRGALRRRGRARSRAELRRAPRRAPKPRASPASEIVVDPGLGFAKRAEHSLALLAGLRRARRARPARCSSARRASRS